MGALSANLIAHVAAEFVNLDSLDLTDTDLGDEGVAYVVEGLCKNRSLRALRIGKNMRTRSKYRAQAVKNIVGYAMQMHTHAHTYTHFGCDFHFLSSCVLLMPFSLIRHTQTPLHSSTASQQNFVLL